MQKECKGIKKRCKGLGKYGYECIFLGVHSSDGDCVKTRSEQGLTISEENNLLYTFANAVSLRQRSLESLSDDALCVKYNSNHTG